MECGEMYSYYFSTPQGCNEAVKAGASSVARHQMALLRKKCNIAAIRPHIAAMFYAYFSSAIWWRPAELVPVLTASLFEKLDASKRIVYLVRRDVSKTQLYEGASNFFAKSA